MTTEQINKAIREEAEKRFAETNMPTMSYFIEGANYLLSLLKTEEKGLMTQWVVDLLNEKDKEIKRLKTEKEMGLSIKPSTNLEQQNENERLNNSEWISVGEYNHAVAEIGRLQEQLTEMASQLDDFHREREGWGHEFK